MCRQLLHKKTSILVTLNSIVATFMQQIDFLVACNCFFHGVDNHIMVGSSPLARDFSQELCCMGFSKSTAKAHPSTLDPSTLVCVECRISSVVEMGVKTESDECLDWLDT